MSINSRKSVDLSTHERGATFTAEQLLFLLQSEPHVDWRIITMTKDATSHGYGVDLPFTVKEELDLAMEWAQLYGDSIMVMYTSGINTLGENREGEAFVDVKAFHPLVNGVGYKAPTSEDLDERGMPKLFRIMVEGVKDEIKVDASRVVIFTWNKLTNTWRGYSAIGVTFDDIVDWRRWRTAYGKRADKVAVPGYYADKPEGKSWDDTELDTLDNIFGEDNVAATSGVTFGTLGGVLAPGEIEQTKEALLESIAAGFAVAKNDIKGAEAGEKLGTDANQSMYFMTLKKIQNAFSRPVGDVLTRLGFKDWAWNTPWEQPAKDKVETFSTLAGIFVTADDVEVKQIAKDWIIREFGEGK